MPRSKHDYRDQKHREAVHKRYPLWRCVFCGHDGSLFAIQVCHLIRRGNLKYRWIPENGVPGCVVCHGTYDNDIEFQNEQDKRLGFDQLKDEIGAGKYKSLFDGG